MVYAFNGCFSILIQFDLLNISAISTSFGIFGPFMALILGGQFGKIPVNLKRKKNKRTKCNLTMPFFALIKKILTISTVV